MGFSVPVTGVGYDLPGNFSFCFRMETQLSSVLFLHLIAYSLEITDKF